MLAKRPALGLIASVAVYVVLWFVVPRAAVVPLLTTAARVFLPLMHGEDTAWMNLMALTLMVTPAFAFLAAQMAVIYFLAQIKASFSWNLLMTVCSLGLAAALLAQVIMHSHIPARLGHYPGLREHFFILSHYYGPARLPITLLAMLAAASVGCMVAIRVRDRNLLLPVVMFAAYIDFWTVTQGPVATVLRHAPEVVSAVSAPIPHAGTGAFMPAAMVGPGDFLFAALVFSAVHRLGMNGPRTFWFILIALTAGMTAIFAGLVGFLPALTLLAAGVVAANWREFHLTRQELAAVVIVGLVLVASLPLIWAALKPHHRAPRQGKQIPSVGVSQVWGRV